MTSPTREKSHLKRDLTSWGAGSFVVTNMIGTGIFTIPAIVRLETGSGFAALTVWIAGAALALCGALCYTELATRMPQAGGEYHFLTRVYGPVWGFLSGWASFIVGFSAAIAAASIGASAYIAAIIPSWNAQNPLLPGLGVTQGAGLAALLVLALTFVHSRGIRPGGRLQGSLAGLTLAAILFLVVAGVASGKGDWSGMWTSTSSGGSWWVALIQVSFAYSGWNAAAYLAGEIKRPGQTLPRALLGGTGVVAVTYLALNVLFLFAIPVGSWEAGSGGGVEIAIAQEAAERLFGPAGARGISVLIALAIVGSISAMTAAGPRVYYAMGSDGLAPRFLSRLNSRTGAPTAALLAQGALASMLALTGAFQALLIYIGSVLLLFNGLTVAAVYRARRLSPSSGGFRIPGYPVTPLVFLAAVITAWVQGLMQAPKPTGAALATVAAGAVFYSLAKTRGWIVFRPQSVSGESEVDSADEPSASRTAVP